MLVLVASLNPFKIKATRNSFEKFFPNDKIEFQGIDTASNVSAQPNGDDTFIGAENRANTLYEYNQNGGLDADFCVAIEGGTVKLYNRWFELGCVCIIDKNGRKAFGNTPAYELPDDIMEKLHKGIELGTVIDELTNSTNIKQQGGAISYFSKGVLNRTDMSSAGVDVALLPLLNPDLYFKK
jgi:inosine/xanthosine triphosphatase